MKKYSYSYKLKKYKQAMKFLECANYIFLEQIKNFEFNKISEYKKSKEIFRNIYKDFLLINELLERKEVLNATTILRKVYENILYIIATSFDKTFVVNIDSQPKEFRVVLEENCEKLFNEGVEKEDFNKIYKYLCKLIHPSSLKEFVAYLENTSKYKMYMINNIKFIMIVIESMYINFLNNKVGINNDFNMAIFDASSYVNLINIVYYLNIADKKGRYVKKYFCHDLTNKYLKENQEDIENFVKYIKKNKKEFDKRINEIIKRADKEIQKSIYKEKVEEILK